jgi:hypothetical protein
MGKRDYVDIDMYLESVLLLYGNVGDTPALSALCLGRGLWNYRFPLGSTRY